MDAKKTTKTLLATVIATGTLAACNNGATATKNDTTIAASDAKKETPKKDAAPKKDVDKVYDSLVQDATKRTGLNFNEKGPEIFGIAHEITVPMGTTMDDLLYGVYALDANGNEVEVKLETELVSFLKAGKYQTYLTAVDEDGNATLYPVNITILPGKTQTTPVNPVEPQPMVAAIEDGQTPDVPEVTPVLTGATDTGSGDNGKSDSDKSDKKVDETEKALKKALQEAKTKLSNAEKAVINAVADLAKKENALAKAEKALEDAKANEAATAEDITRAEENLTAKKKAYSDAEKARVDAYNAYMKAVNDATNSPEYQAAVEAVNAKNDALVGAMGVAASALAQFDSATSALETAQASVDAKKEELNNAEKALKAAVDNKNATEEAIKELETAVSEKKTALEQANADLKTAQDAYDAVAKQLTDSPEYQAAVAATEASNNEMLAAIGVAAETANTVTEKKTALEEAKSAKAEKDEILEEKKAAAEEADKALAEAIDKADELRAASKAAGQNTAAAEQELAALEEQIATAQQNKKNIEADINKTLADMEGYDQAIEDARAAYERATAAYNEAKKQVAKGSIGFFQEREAEQGADTSIDSLLNQSIANAIAAGRTDTGITHVGAEGDATSLENMKLAVSYLHECNELRKTDDNNSGSDKDPLEVTDVMMLGAQVEANYSSEKYEHNTLFKGDWGGQILANMYNGQDPYYAWYTKEKKVYDEGRNGTTGHYKIIANPDGSSLYHYTTTGIGVNTTTENRQTWMQNFYDGNSHGAKSWSVDEYESAFLEYYNRVTGAVKTAQAAMNDAKNAYIASINANTGMSDSEKETLIASAEAMFEGTAKIDNANEQIAQFTSLYDSAAIAAASAESTYEADVAKFNETLASMPDDQRKAFDELLKKYDEMDAAYAAMQAATGEEREYYYNLYYQIIDETNAFRTENNLGYISTLHSFMNTNKGKVDKANEFLADVEKKLGEMNDQKAALESELEGLKAQYGTDLLASGATAEEKAKIEKLNAELDSINASIDNLSDAIVAGTQAVEEAKEAQADAAAKATAAADTVNELAEDAKDAKAEAETAQENADEAAQTATNAEEAYNSALAAKAEADKTVEDKKAAYEAAKANADEVARQINENVDSAKAAVDSAATKAEEAKAEYDYLLTLSDEAIADNEAAGRALEEAKGNVEAAETALESAQADLATAQADAEAKQGALDKANADVKAAQAEYDTAVTNAENIKTEIDATVAEQKDAYEAAEEVVDNAGKEVVTAEAAVTEATTAHDNAVEAVKTATTTVETAETAKAEAEVVLETATQAQEVAQSEYNEVKEVYDYYKDNGELPAVQAEIHPAPIVNVPYETEQVTETTTYDPVENEVVITETTTPEAAPAEAAPEPVQEETVETPEVESEVSADAQ